MPEEKLSPEGARTIARILDAVHERRRRGEVVVTDASGNVIDEPEQVRRMVEGSLRKHVIPERIRNLMPPEVDGISVPVTPQMIRDLTEGQVVMVEIRTTLDEQSHEIEAPPVVVFLRPVTRKSDGV